MFPFFFLLAIFFSVVISHQPWLHHYEIQYLVETVPPPPFLRCRTLTLNEILTSCAKKQSFIFFQCSNDGVLAGRPRKSFDHVLEMTEPGLSISLAAYPSPDSFVFFHLGNVTSGRGSEVSSSRFSSLCRQDAVTLSMVYCTITPVDVPKTLLGFYRTTISNDIGSVNFIFSIESEGIVVFVLVHSFFKTDWLNLDAQCKS